MKRKLLSVALAIIFCSAAHAQNTCSFDERILHYQAQTKLGFIHKIRKRQNAEAWPNYFCKVPLALYGEKKANLQLSTIGEPESLCRFFSPVFLIDGLGAVLVLESDNIQRVMAEVTLCSDYTEEMDKFRLKPLSYTQSNNCQKNLYFVFFSLHEGKTEYVALEFSTFKAGARVKLMTENEFQDKLFIKVPEAEIFSDLASD